MATRKENIDIEYDEPQQKAVSGAAESNDPYESQDPADWVPPMTVRIYPISKPRSKLLATASVNIAKFFFFMFHRPPFFYVFFICWPYSTGRVFERCFRIVCEV